MEISKRSQEGGDHSVNVQAETINVNTGLSISHVKEIALEVFEGNFYKLAGVAKETADQRAKEITDQFLEELAAKNPDGLKASEDPDFQHSLFQAQKEYARCGDKELGDILVDILVDRSKEEDRSLLQVVLNESLSIAPKLNTTQLDILACCFNFAYTRRLTIRNTQMFADYLNDAVLIFSDAVGEKDSNYRHLEYVGCASIRTGKRDIVSILLQTYKAIFCKGFERENLNDIAENDPNIWKAVIPSLHNVNLIQAGGMDDETIKTICIQHGISEGNANKLIQINNQQMMNKKEATDYLKSICPKFEKFIEDANKTAFNSLELTSVGIAIAHAHSRKKAGFDADLSIWI
ncbi:LPO_1073/Vpar_1526 family protein [Shewanella algae]|uniref:LPO_1073/Vpar_1526 family protein n=1 Tax=Shewanella algae TaxID=38313 RepID=UPI0031F5ACF3